MFIKNRFMFFFIIFFETVGCKEIKKKEEKNSFDDLAVLYLNGNKNEALEVAEMILKNGIKKQKTDYINESPTTVFSHAFLARVQKNEQVAESLFEFAAKKFQQTKKMKEASISYAEQGLSFMFLGKFKESDQCLKKAINLLEGSDCLDMPRIREIILDYQGRRKTLIMLAESDPDLNKKMALHSKETATPISIQYEILNNFGIYFMSTGEYEESEMCFKNARNLIEAGLTLSEDAKKDIQKNLERVTLKLKEKRQENP